MELPGVYRSAQVPVLRGMGAVAICAILLMGGCGALQAPEPDVRPVPGWPVWERRDVREHLDFLNSSSATARSPGSEAIATAAEYVAARMRGYRLQPVYEQGFRMHFNVPAHRVDAAHLSVMGADSVSLAIGYDFLPDSRSDSGRVTMSFVHIAPTAEAVPFPAAASSAYSVMIPAEVATTERVEALAGAGFRLLLIVGEFAPRSAARPVDGMLVIQVPVASAAWITGLAPRQFEALWSQSDVLLRPLPRRLYAEVGTSTFPSVAAVNVAGFVAGRHPSLARDLVMVIANLDEPSLVAGERVTDYRSFGMGVTALLEVARNEIEVAHRWAHPMRTILFAAVTGRDAEGLANLLRSPPWEIARIRTAIYVGLRADDEAAVRKVLSSHGISLEVVPFPDEPLYERRYVVASERSARGRSPVPQTQAAPRPPESSLVMMHAVEAVFQMADELHRQVERHAGLLPAPNPTVVVQSAP